MAGRSAVTLADLKDKPLVDFSVDKKGDWMVVWTIGKRVDMKVEWMVVPTVVVSDTGTVACLADALVAWKVLRREALSEIRRAHQRADSWADSAAATMVVYSVAYMVGWKGCMMGACWAALMGLQLVLHWARSKVEMLADERGASMGEGAAAR